jgi:hypothetical protein
MAASKFAERNFVEFTDGFADSIGDRFFDYLRHHSDIKYYSVSAREAYRIDLIADNLYHNKDLYWILMRLNGFMHVEDFSEGSVIQYVTMSDIESAYLHWQAVT